MYCKHCGNQIDDNSLFCPKCEKSTSSDATQNQANVQLHWILIFVSIGLVLLGLLLGFNLGNNSEAEDVILPAILSLGSVCLSGHVYMATKSNPEDKKKHLVSLLVLIGGILMAVELCIGPLIGTLIG